MQIPRVIAWQALEHEHGDRSNDWYWGVGTVAVTAVFLTAFFGNYLLAVIVALAAFTSIIHAQRGPELFRYELNSKGVVIGETFYPYKGLASFWIDHVAYRPRLTIKPKSAFGQLLVLPITDLDDEIMREFLLDHLPEVEYTEPLTKKLLERIGF